MLCSSSSLASSTVSSTDSKACKDLWKESKKSTLFKGMALLELPHVDTPEPGNAKRSSKPDIVVVVFFYLLFGPESSHWMWITHCKPCKLRPFCFLNGGWIFRTFTLRRNASSNYKCCTEIMSATMSDMLGICLSAPSVVWQTRHKCERQHMAEFGRSVGLVAVLSSQRRSNICEKKRPEVAMFQFFCVEVRL